MTTIGESLARVRARIAEAARRAGREPSAVRLVAVSKRVGPDRIREAVAAGQRLFGENFIQEAQEKVVAVGPGVSWHCIGHLQSNKAKAAATLFDVVETVDSIKLARILDSHLARLGKKMPVFVQVNIGRERQKSGVLPEEAVDFVTRLASFPFLLVRGLMAVPPFLPEAEALRPYFRELRELRDRILKDGVCGLAPLELSMGMSGDFEVAIEEGATIVRVGTALFGEREPGERERP